MSPSIDLTSPKTLRGIGKFFIGIAAVLTLLGMATENGTTFIGAGVVFAVIATGLFFKAINAAEGTKPRNEGDR